MGTPVLGVSVNFSLKPLKMIHPLWEHSTVPASGKLTHCQLFCGRPQVKHRFYCQQEAFVIVGIPDFCPALAFVNRLPDNNSGNNDNSCTV